MKFIVKKANPQGCVRIPGSKSHTIRALIAGLMAEGISTIRNPLVSSDTLSCASMIRSFGAEISESQRVWKVTGSAGNPITPENVIDVGNSGTSLYLGLGIASLIKGVAVFTGDGQIRNRPADRLIASLNDLGAEVFSTRNNGSCPIVVKGPLCGGETTIESVTSQYLTALLLAAPFAQNETIIRVSLLNEKPYVGMTLDWLDYLGVEYENRDFREFKIRGGQSVRAFDREIPADFSSATFFLCLGAVTGADITLHGLDFSDTQGDKEVVNILSEMGAVVDIKENSIKIRGNSLTGGTFDLNSIPDSLPALAVTACFAEGETRLVNVPQARVKETDRIRVMFEELTKLGADIEELEDGLIIRKSTLTGCSVNGHGDHRVIMALAVAGSAIEGSTLIDTAEAVSVTFPDFRELMVSLGSNIEIQEDE